MSYTRSPILLKHFPHALISAIVILGIGQFVIATSMGIGLSPDSAQYISGARCLLRGDGFSFPAGDGTPIPISLWPPMYSLVLAIPMALGVNEFTAARWLGGILYALNILLVYHLLVRATKGSRYVGLMGASFFLVSKDILLIHTWAWSEALFLSLGLSGLYICIRYLEDQKRRDYVFSAGLLAAASLTRYPGLAFLAGASIVLFFFLNSTLKERFQKAALFLFMGIFPTILWITRNLIVSGSASNRSFDDRGISLQDIKSTLHVMTLWFIPGRFERAWSLYLTVLGVSCLFLLAIFWVFRYRKVRSKAVLRDSLAMLVVTAIAYTGIVVFAKAFVKPDFALADPRFLAPILVFIIMIGVLCGYESLRWLQDWIQTQARILPTPRLLSLNHFIALIVFAYFCSFNVFHLVKWIDHRAERGQGYASVSWQNSEIMNHLKMLPEGTTLYSNGYDVIALLLNHPVYRIPLKLHANPERREVDYDREILAMAERLREDQGFLVYFTGITWRRMMTKEDILETTELVPVWTTNDGVIYTFP